MPVLRVSDSRGRLDAAAPAFLLAVMLYPDDHEAMAAALTLEALNAMAGSDGTVAVDTLLLRAAREAPSRRGLASEVADRSLRGDLAGRLLLFVLRCAEHSPRRASSRKAIEVLHRRLVEEGAERYGKTFIKDSWSRHRPVAHLWAARLIATQGGCSDESIFRVGPELLGLLAVADSLRRRGEDHRPPYGGRFRKDDIRLLNSSRSWTVPEDLPLPPVEVRMPELTAWEKAALRR